MTNWITKIHGSDLKNSSASEFIANRQAAESAAAIGFKEINYFTYDMREASDEEINIRVTTLLSGVQPDDVVIVQWPMWQYDERFERFFMQKLRLIPEIKLAALLWDVLPWMKGGVSLDYTEHELFQTLNAFDLVIAANPKMARRLRKEGGVKVAMLSMDLSDSLYQGPLKEKTDFNKLYFIGSQINQTMVSDYTAQTPFEMIGEAEGLDKANAAIHFLGKMSSEKIPAMIDGGFGVVHYATSSQFKGAAKYGDYNNPMKLSQYLAAGIPVIIGSQMAHADLVKRQNLGLVLDDLNAIDEVLSDLTLADYQAKLAAIKPWSEAVRNGYFAKRACLETLRILKLGQTDSLAEQAKSADET